MNITITGIQNIDDRTLVFFDIDYKSNLYKWQDYCTGSMEDISKYLQDKIPSYSSYIDLKEALWEVTPKTRTVDGPMGESITINVSKEEIVCPPPDYVELRKREYPNMADYLDGVVKGDQSQIDKYIADCLAVKEKYPKSYL